MQVGEISVEGVSRRFGVHRLFFLDPPQLLQSIRTLHLWRIRSEAVRTDL